MQKIAPLDHLCKTVINHAGPSLMHVCSCATQAFANIWEMILITVTRGLICCLPRIPDKRAHDYSLMLQIVQIDLDSVQIGQLSAQSNW